MFKSSQDYFQYLIDEGASLETILEDYDVEPVDALEFLYRGGFIAVDERYWAPEEDLELDL